MNTLARVFASPFWIHKSKIYANCVFKSVQKTLSIIIKIKGISGKKGLCLIGIIFLFSITENNGAHYNLWDLGYDELQCIKNPFHLFTLFDPAFISRRLS